MISLIQIDYFLETAECLNFTTAAENLFISQPALSKQISLLENEIGTRLFERKSRKVFLTPAGEALRSDMLRIKTEFADSVARVAAIGKEKIKKLRIGCFDGRVNDDFLGKVTNCLSKYDPEIHMDFVTSNMAGVERMLRDGEIDYAVTIQDDYVEQPGYSAALLIKRKTALIYSPKLFRGKEAIGLDDFRNEKPLLPKADKGHRLRQSNIETLNNLGLNPEDNIKSDNIETLMVNLKMGKGYALLSADVAKEFPSLKAYALPEEYDTKVLIVVRDDNIFAKKIFDAVFAE
ncbi:MAG: LysR family transcriptional regulator [Parasporobacterium sp.]|nr:LysR family transcriptional regulator [Parasporobacterium sp.]